MQPAIPLKYIRDLMEKNYEAVGFIPLPRLEADAAAGRILVQYENDEPCGYLHFGNGWPVLKVFQCCIQTDARRAKHASELVNQLIEIARVRNCSSIALRCAEDLESNTFWKAMGFHFAGQDQGGSRRGRMLNRWVTFVDGTAQLRLFAA